MSSWSSPLAEHRGPLAQREVAWHPQDARAVAEKNALTPSASTAAQRSTLREHIVFSGPFGLQSVRRMRPSSKGGAAGAVITAAGYTLVTGRYT